MCVSVCVTRLFLLSPRRSSVCEHVARLFVSILAACLAWVRRWVLSLVLSPRRLQANDDAGCWLPSWNYDLGGTVEYDEAVLWLDQRLQLVVWYPRALSGALAAQIRAHAPSLPAAGSHGAFFFLYLQESNVAMLLVSWEPENAHGWPVQAGTAFPFGSSGNSSSASPSSRATSSPTSEPCGLPPWVDDELD